MKRRAFLGALLAAPVAIKLAPAGLPALLKDTPQEVIRRARVEYKDNCYRVYDETGKLRVQFGVW